MTILELIKNHTLEEILENDDLLTVLGYQGCDFHYDHGYESITLPNGACYCSINDVCLKHKCEYLKKHSNADWDWDFYCSLNDELYRSCETEEEFEERAQKCPYIKEHKRALQESAKQFFFMKEVTI